MGPVSQPPWGQTFTNSHKYGRMRPDIYVD